MKPICATVEKASDRFTLACVSMTSDAKQRVARLGAAEKGCGAVDSEAPVRRGPANRRPGQGSIPSRGRRVGLLHRTVAWSISAHGRAARSRPRCAGVDPRSGLRVSPSAPASRAAHPWSPQAIAHTRPTFQSDAKMSVAITHDCVRHFSRTLQCPSPLLVFQSIAAFSFFLIPKMSDAAIAHEALHLKQPPCI